MGNGTFLGSGVPKTFDSPVAKSFKVFASPAGAIIIQTNMETILVSVLVGNLGLRERVLVSLAKESDSIIQSVSR